MLKLAANLDWLFTDLPIAARFQAAKAAGFHGIEGLFLWQHPLEQLQAAQRQTSLPLVLMNAPAGNWSQGERGLAALPGREEEFHRSLERARHYATALGCRRVHVMAGLRCDALTHQAQLELLRTRLRIACDVLAVAGIDVLIEPLNSQDMPGYFIDSFPLAAAIIDQVARNNIVYSLIFITARKFTATSPKILNATLRLSNIFKLLPFLIAMNLGPAN